MFSTRRLLSFLGSVWALIFFGSCGGEGEERPDCAIAGPSVTIAAITHPTCTSLGSIEAASTSGEQPVVFSINGVDFQSGSRFTNLEPGTYVLTAKDAHDCSASTSVSLSLQNDLIVTYTATEAGCGGSDGSIEISTEGGSGNYLFSVDGEHFVESASFSGLAPGALTITVRDGQCEQETAALVPSGISYDALVAPIITSKCAIEDCHGGRQAPDFRVFANVKASSSQIGIYVDQSVMPPEGEGVEPLTVAEAGAILCWVADGAPDN